MTAHEDKGLLEIKYNHLNLPDYNKFDQAAIRTDLNGNNTAVYKNTTYLYRADGVKLKKHTNILPGETTEAMYLKQQNTWMVFNMK